MASRLESAYQIILQQTSKSAIAIPPTNKIQTFGVSSLEFIDNETNVISFLNIRFTYHYITNWINFISYYYMQNFWHEKQTWLLRSLWGYCYDKNLWVEETIVSITSCCLETIDFQFIYGSFLHYRYPNFMQ